MENQFVSLLANPVIISSIIALISGSVGYFINFFINKRKELSSEFTAKRRGMYKEFTSIVIDIFKGVKGKNTNFKDKINKLYDFYKDYLLYASPEVINSFSDYFQLIYEPIILPENPTTEEQLKYKEYTKKQIIYLSKIIQSMRKDLGLNNQKLGRNGEKVFRALLKDFDNYFNKK